MGGTTGFWFPDGCNPLESESWSTNSSKNDYYPIIVSFPYPPRQATLLIVTFQVLISMKIIARDFVEFDRHDIKN